MLGGGSPVWEGGGHVRGEIERGVVTCVGEKGSRGGSHREGGSHLFGRKGVTWGESKRGGSLVLEGEIQ